MKTKKKYIAPALKSYAYQVEVGFANSFITPYGQFHTNGIEEWEGWDLMKPSNDNGNFGGNGTAGSNVGEWDWDN